MQSKGKEDEEETDDTAFGRHDGGAGSGRRGGFGGILCRHPWRRHTFGGTNGPDKLAGRGGHDLIYGLSGPDDIAGERGNYALSAGPTRERAVDRVVGGFGNDAISIYNKPAALDLVSCGPGFDTLYTDKKDEYFSDVNPDCERIRNRAP